MKAMPHRIKASFPTIVFYSLTGIILFLAILAMVRGIGTRSLLLDEAFFARNLNDFPNGYYYHSAPSAPLFYLVSWALTVLIGKTEWVLRLLPFLSGAFGLILMGRMFVRDFSKGAALTAVLLAATSYPMIHFGGNAHPYSTDCFWSALQLVLTLGYFRRPNRYWTFWVIAAFVGVASSFTAIFTTAAFGLLIGIEALIRKDKTAKIRIFWILALAIWSVLMYLFFYSKLSSDRGDIPYWSQFFLSSPWPHQAARWLFERTSEIAAYFFWNRQNGLIGVFLMILGTGWLVSKKRFWIAAVVWSPILMVVAVSTVQKWPYGPVRTMMFALPFYAYLMGAGFQWIVERIQGRWTAAIIAIALAVVVLPQAWVFKPALARPGDSEEAIKSLKSAIAPEIKNGDRFLVYCSAEVQFRFYFPDRIQQADFEPWSYRKNPDLYRSFVSDGLLRHPGRIWLIFSHIEAGEDDEMIQRASLDRKKLSDVSMPGCRAVLFDSAAGERP